YYLAFNTESNCAAGNMPLGRAHLLLMQKKGMDGWFDMDGGFKGLRDITPFLGILAARLPLLTNLSRAALFAIVARLGMYNYQESHLLLIFVVVSGDGEGLTEGMELHIISKFSTRITANLEVPHKHKFDILVRHIMIIWDLGFITHIILTCLIAMLMFYLHPHDIMIRFELMNHIFFLSILVPSICGFFLIASAAYDPFSDWFALVFVHFCITKNVL
ncbi:hypothetical protein ACJX0J_029263, partial [Zea mays]